MLFTNPELNFLSFIFFVLIVLCCVGIVPWLMTNRELNRMKYPGDKKLKKKKDTEIDEFELPFRKTNWTVTVLGLRVKKQGPVILSRAFFKTSSFK
jgi:hypothetical protein